jgi:hypothetical protein
MCNKCRCGIKSKRIKKRQNKTVSTEEMYVDSFADLI